MGHCLEFIGRKGVPVYVQVAWFPRVGKSYTIGKQAGLNGERALDMLLDSSWGIVDEGSH